MLCAAQNAAGQPSRSPVRQFARVSFSRFPRSVVLRDFCQGWETECWQIARGGGHVWAGDVNGDGIDELVFHPGALESGSAGWGFYLYQRRGRDWHSIAGPMERSNTQCSSEEEARENPGWFTDRFRFDVLPISRSGYRDLRVSVDLCLKWDGQRYIPYEPADYRALSPAWFDHTNPQEAEIFWMIRYAGRKSVQFEPEWFPITSSFLYEESDVRACQLTKKALKWFRQTAEPPRSAITDLNDAEENIHWFSLSRAGVWGVQGGRGYLLVPRTSYLGACSLVMFGEWLAGFDGCAEYPESKADFRYNRRTRELQLQVSCYGSGCEW